MTIQLKPNIPGVDKGVSVYMDNQLVGWLKIPPSQLKGNYLPIQIEEEDVPIWKQERGALPHHGSAKRIELKIGKHKKVIDRFQMDQSTFESEQTFLHHFYAANQIPQYASRYEEHLSGSFIVQWAVLEVSQKDFEAVFDLDSFEPNEY